MKLIDKDAVLAEIERRIKAIPRDETDKRLKAVYGNEAFVLHDLLSFLDTIKVEEVDLEKEIDECLKKHNMLAVGKKDFTEIAKHFFELGLSASNPLTWEDIKTIQNISGEVYAEVAKGKDDFYSIYPTEQSFLEEVLNRFKAQKGEEV